MKSTFKIISCILLVLSSLKGNAQTKFGDNKTTINGSSLLELESTNKGLLMPRISLTNTTTWGLATATPVNGMVVYNTNTAMAGTAAAPTLTGIAGMYYWDGAKWVGMAGQQKTQTDSVYWALHGNAGTTPPVAVGTAAGTNNYWGTTDTKNLALGTNGTTRAIFDQNGNAFGGNGSLVSTGGFLGFGGNFIWGVNDTTINSDVSAVFGAFNRSGGDMNLIGGGYNKISNSGNLAGGTNNFSSGGLNLISGNTNNSTGSGNAIFGLSNKVASDNSIVGGERDTLVQTAGYSAVFGRFNKDSAAYTLVSGRSNIAGLNSLYSSISGTGNTISTSGSSEGNMMFGIGSTIDGTYSAANLVGGYYNSIHATESSSNANAVFGYLNTLNGPRAGQNLVGGTAHQIWSTGNAVTGSNNKIGLNTNYNVVGGNSNVIPDDPSLNAFGGRNAIFGGENKDSAAFTLVAGFQNSISTNAWYSTVSGYYNHIYGGVAVGIFGTANNAYNTPGFFNNNGGGFISGSSNNLINNNSSAIFGESNTVYGNTSGTTGAFVAGSNNKDSASFTFAAGQYNIIKPGATNSVALGANNTAGHTNSFALGNGATTTKANQLVAKFSGGVVLSPLPSYATDAAADADATLPSGSLYKLTGSRAVFQKP